MKMKKICLAVGSAFAAGMASQAFALAPTQDGSSTLQAFVTGSTALEPVVRAYARSLCVNGSMTEFQVQAVSQSGAAIYNPSPANQKQLVWQCTLTTPIGTHTSLTLRKSSGDSGEGLTAANGLYPVNFVDTSTPTNVAAFSCSGTITTVATDTGLAGLQQQQCTYTGTFISATGSGLVGLADVEPSLLNNAISSAVPDTTKSTVTTVGANVWGVAVTTALRNKLQAVQGLSVGDDSSAYMPSLSKSTLYSIFAGQFPSAAALTDGSNNPITGAFTGSNGVTAPSTTANALYFLRRPESSGTMTSFKAMFGDVGCSSTIPWRGDGVGTTTTCTTTTTSGKPVQVWQSTGNLLSCMTSLNTAGRYAVGIASTTNNPVPGGSGDKGYRWIKVDGAVPSLFNVAINKYPFYTEATLMTPNAGTVDPNGISLQPTGDAATFYSSFANGLRTPAIVAKVNNDNTGPDQTSYSDFQAGFVLTNAVTQSLSTVTTSYPIQNGSPYGCSGTCTTGLLINPVIPSTRNTANANSCQPVLQFSNGNQPVNVQ